MKNTSLRSIKTVIRTKDFNVSKDFYTRILQLAIDEEYDDGGAKGCIIRVGDEAGNAFIEISEVKKDDNYFQADFARESETDKVDMQIRTEDVDYWAKRLKENDWPARGPVLRPWGFRYLYLRDPDNLQIIIYEE